MGVRQLLDDDAFFVAHRGLVHMAPIAFVQLQCLDAGEFGLGA